MNFKPHTQEELKEMNIQDSQFYKIEFLNRDYFNAAEELDIKEAKAIVNENGEISFLIIDDFGMDKFIKDVKVLN